LAEVKLLDKVSTKIRTRHYSRRTEQAYAGWIRKFIVFHNKKHPSVMGAEEINHSLIIFHQITLFQVQSARLKVVRNIFMHTTGLKY